MSAEILIFNELGSLACMKMGDDAWGLGDDAWGMEDDAWGMGDDAWGGDAFAKESLCAEPSRHDIFDLHRHAIKHMLSVSDVFCSRVETKKLLKTI